MMQQSPVFSWKHFKSIVGIEKVLRILWVMWIYPISSGKRLYPVSTNWHMNCDIINAGQNAVIQKCKCK